LLQFANFDTWVWELQGALSLRLNFELLTLIINYPTDLRFEFLFWTYSNLMLGLAMAKQQSGLPSFKTLGGWRQDSMGGTRSRTDIQEALLLASRGQDICQVLTSNTAEQ
jgi:hypothetical protein